MMDVETVVSTPRIGRSDEDGYDVHFRTFVIQEGFEGEVAQFLSRLRQRGGVVLKTMDWTRYGWWEDVRSDEAVHTIWFS